IRDGHVTGVQTCALPIYDWALALAKGKHVWHDSRPLAWDREVARFFAALAAFDEYLAGTQPLGFPAEQLFQGPIADSLTHIGQKIGRASCRERVCTPDAV